MSARQFVGNRKAVVQHFFVFIIGIFMVVVLFMAGVRVIKSLFCISAVSSTANDVERLREIVNRVYAGAQQATESFEVNVPGGTKYCFRGGQVYVEGDCIAEGFIVEKLIVHNTHIDDNIRAQVNEMAVIIDETDEDTSTATICLTPGYYTGKFERTRSKVNLAFLYGSRDRDTN